MGTMAPSTIGPSRFRHSGNRKPSRPQPIVSINQTQTRGLPCKVRVDFVVVHIVGDVSYNLVWLRTDGGLSVVSGHGADREGGSSGGWWTRVRKGLGSGLPAKG